MAKVCGAFKVFKAGIYQCQCEPGCRRRFIVDKRGRATYVDSNLKTRRAQNKFIAQWRAGNLKRVGEKRDV